MNSMSGIATQCGRIIIRRAWVTDVELVVLLANAVPAAAQWSHAAYSAYCAVAQAEAIQTRILFVACAAGRDTQGEIVGLAAFSAVPAADGGECELQNMAVAEPWRRQGIARRLLASGLIWCSACGSVDKLWLEVRASNSKAIAFYENAGFVATGHRPRYYTQPEEDAVLMSIGLRSPLQRRTV
jgi:ribosomal protein S18 acetylase RimI-like enzyme